MNQPDLFTGTNYNTTYRTESPLFPVHQTENNAKSQANLNANKVHFSKQCQIIFDLLMSGRVLTIRSMMVEYNINSGTRRCADLKANEVQFTVTWSGQARYVVYSMTPEQVKENREKFLK